MDTNCVKQKCALWDARYDACVLLTQARYHAEQQLGAQILLRRIDEKWRDI